MSSSGHQSSSQTSTFPPQLAQLLRGGVGDWSQALKTIEGSGGLSQLLNPNPEQIAQLTSGQEQNIGQLQDIAKNGSPQEQQSQSLIDQLTGGPIGSSPATQAAMRAYDQNVQPTIESSIAATGGGRGGNLTAALTQGETSAYAPLVQQEVANREAGIGQTQALGQQRSGDISTALNASDLERQISQAGLSANFQDFLRRSGLIQQLTMGPVELLGPSAIGQHSNQSTGSQKF